MTSIDRFWRRITTDAQLQRIVAGDAEGWITVEPLPPPTIGLRVIIAPEYQEAWQAMRTIWRHGRPGHQPCRKRIWGMRWVARYSW